MKEHRVRLPERELDVSGRGARSFIQRQVADLSMAPLLPMGKATASVLTVVGGVHRITAASIPSGGTEFERRWQLARDMNGRPVLWIQRQRKALVAPPAHLFAFDVAEPMDAGAAP